MARLEGDDANLVAVLQAALAHDDDLLAFLDAVGDLDVACISESGRYVALAREALLHDEHRSLAVRFDQRDARDLECLLFALEHDADAREHAWFEHRARIVDFDRDFEGRRTRIDGRRDE